MSNCLIFDRVMEVLGYLDDSDKNNLGEKQWDFVYILNYLRQKNDEKITKTLNIFSPLLINTYNEYALFKYKGLNGLDEDNELSAFEDAERFWNFDNGIYRECRSIVINIKKKEIVLRPQKKFWNVNELKECSEDNIKKMIEQSLKVEFSNKLDGSNINGRYYDNQYFLCGAQALTTENSWRLENCYKLLDENYKRFMKDYKDYTFMFEYISPDNVIVVNYTKEQEGLYLFGLKKVDTGIEMPYEDVIALAQKYNIKSTEIYNESFNSILSKLDDYSCNEKEGWVINIINKDMTNYKVKLKVNDYVLMHRALSKIISPNAIIEAIAEDRWDDFKSKIPCAYRENAEEISKQVINYIKFMEKNVEKIMEEAKEELGEGYFYRKRFVIFLDKPEYKKFKHYCILKYDNKQFNYLKHNQTGYKKLNELTL